MPRLRQIELELEERHERDRERWESAMKDDWRTNHNHLPPPDGSEDRPDGIVSIAILAFAVVAPLIYFGPRLGAVEAWFVDVYRIVDSWVAPIRELVFG